MHPRIQELVDYLDREQAYLEKIVADFPHPYTNAKPAPEAWCAADVVHHLAIMDQRIGAALAAGMEAARANGVGPDPIHTPILPELKVAHVLDRSRKFRNPKGDPPSWLPMDRAVDALRAARRDFKAAITADDLPDLSKVSVPHPAFGALNGYEWVAFTAAHTHRHADQIQEIRATLGL